MLRKVFSTLAVLLSVFAAGAALGQGTEIRLGTLKAWRYDRVYPQLDALMRDVDGTTLKRLSDLDPAAMNSSVVDVLQTYVGIAAAFDQGAGITNRANLQQFQAVQPGQLAAAKAQSEITQQLYARKSQLTSDLIAALGAQTTSSGKLAADTPCSKDPTCAQAAAHVAQVQDEIKSIDAAIASNTAAAATAPNLTAVSPGGPTPPQLAGVLNGDVAKSLFQNAGKSIVANLPPREQVESFITLLQELSMKKLAMGLDEWGESGKYVPVIAEFEVSIQPESKRKNQQAVSRFEISIPPAEKQKNPSCSEPKVYNLYPSMAAFNVSAVDGMSKGASFAGVFKWLAAGASVNVQRQRDRLQQSMQQSVYISGYQEAKETGSTLGWYYGAPVFQKVARPGTYATFAVILVPKRQGAADTESDLCQIHVSGATFWSKKGADQSPASVVPDMLVHGEIVPPPSRPWVHSVSYYPMTGTDEQLSKVTNTVAIEFNDPVDPNLMVSANNMTLLRVRDSRGRSTVSDDVKDRLNVVDAAGTTRSISRSRGLLEADVNDPDTWIQISQKKILLRLSSTLAGTAQFPDVRLIVPGEGQQSLAELLDYRTYRATLQAGAKTYFACHPKLSAYKVDSSGGVWNAGCMRQPVSIWYPLFAHKAQTRARLRIVRVNTTPPDAPDNSANDRPCETKPKDPDHCLNGAPSNGRPVDAQRYYYLRLEDGTELLDGNARVTISAPGHQRSRNPIALECAPLEGGLLCHTHVQTIAFGILQENTSVPLCVGGSKPAPGADSVAWYNSSDQRCDLNNYRLELEVFQPSTIAGQEPLVATVPLPDLSVPESAVVGTPHVSAWDSRKGGTAEAQVYYAGAAAFPKQVCVRDESENQAQATLSAGASPRNAILKIALPKNKTPLLNGRGARVLEQPCDPLTSKQLGVIPALARPVVPVFTIHKLGKGQSVYYFESATEDPAEIENAFVQKNGKQTSLKTVRVDAKRFLVDATTTASGRQLKQEDGEVLYFANGPFTVPAYGCLETPGKAIPKKDGLPEVLGIPARQDKTGALMRPAVPYKAAVAEVPASTGPATTVCGPVLVGAKAETQGAKPDGASTVLPDAHLSELLRGTNQLNSIIRLQ